MGGGIGHGSDRPVQHGVDRDGEALGGQAGCRRVGTRVAEVIALAPGEKEPGYATTHVFRADATGVAVPDVLPDEYRRLAQYGFDLAAYLGSQQLGART